MSRTLIVRPRAERDLSEASLWYERRVLGLGAHFIRCVDAAVSLVLRHPEAGPIYFRQFHRVLVSRFPFGVFYTVEVEAVVVHAVLHLSRDPERIRKLLQTGHEYEEPTG